MSDQRPVLVIGRSGQLATDLAIAAGARGIPFVALGRPEFDITHPDAAARAIDALEPRAVINAAAYTNVDEAESEGELAFAINALGPRYLAVACARSAVPLIHVSTDQVFDGTKDGPYTEDDTPNPINLYGRSKLAGDEAVMNAFPEALVARVSWVWGPSGDNFVKKLLAWAKSRDTLQIVCDQRGRPTYSPALAHLFLDFGRSMPPQGVLNVAGASVLTRFRQAQLVLEILARRGGPCATVEPVLTCRFPTAAARPLNAELDTSLVTSRYGLKLARFEEDLAQSVQSGMLPA